MRSAAEGKLILTSLLHEMARAENAVMDAVGRLGFDEHDRFAIKLALEEALANAIKHGNHGDPSKSVTVEFRADPDTISISVEDEGGGFCPSQVADPTLDENLEKPNGRGVMLMRVYMNEVRFNPAGNRVTLVKRRTHSEKPPWHDNGRQAGLNRA